MATTYAFPTTTSPASETSELQNHSVAHSRNLSTVSSVTLHANTSLHSTPHEPISHACDVISYHSRLSPVILPPRWSQNNLKQPFLRDEKIKSTGSATQCQSKRLRWVKIGLETVMVVWSLYTMIRYLYAFTIYDSLNGQLAAFGLGILAGLSFAFTCCSIILSAVNKHLLGRGVYVKSLSSVHSVLQYPPSLCFLFPAITNFVLLLVWRNISTLDLNLHHRCKVDVDLVWTITYSRCDNLGQPWGVWIVLAFVRVVLSFLVIIAFHNVQSSQVIPMPKLSYAKTTMRQRSLPPKQTSKVFSKKFPSFTRKEPVVYHRPTEYSSSLKSPSLHELRSATSHSSGNSEGAPSYSNTDFLPTPNPTQNESTFMERFRRLVSIITQETDDAVAYARASVVSTSCNSEDTAESPTLNESCQALDEEPHSPGFSHIFSYDDQEDDFYGPPLAEHSDCNYPQPYPADEQIRMMNGFIKRMPTIESMGSRELVGSTGTNHERNGPRPSTRNTMLSWNGTDMSGSDPRRRSLTAQAELLYGRNGASEVGELVKQGMSIKMVGSYGSSDTQGDNQESLPDYHSSTSGSKNSAQSFHTAHSGMDKGDNLKTSVSDVPIQSDEKCADTTPLPNQDSEL